MRNRWVLSDTRHWYGCWYRYMHYEQMWILFFITWSTLTNNVYIVFSILNTCRVMNKTETGECIQICLIRTAIIVSIPIELSSSHLSNLFSLWTLFLCLDWSANVRSNGNSWQEATKAGKSTYYIWWLLPRLRSMSGNIIISSDAFCCCFLTKCCVLTSQIHSIHHVHRKM